MYLAEQVVLNTTDGTRRSIMNGYASDGSQWTEYEITTEYGTVEVWRTTDMLVLE